MTINKNAWKNIIQFLITVLTALGTAFGVTSCVRKDKGGKLKKLVPFTFIFKRKHILHIVSMQRAILYSHSSYRW